MPIHILREYLEYNADTGEFTWVKQSGYRGKVGSVAGGMMAHGYRIVTIHGVKMLEHRVAWAMHYGIWPSFEIDHINRIRNDNRIKNLREATRSQNARNGSLRRNNKLGVTGVWRKYNKYIASICIDGRTVVLGRFITIQEAKNCYDQKLSMILKTPPSGEALKWVPFSKTKRKPQGKKSGRPAIEDVCKSLTYRDDGILIWASGPRIGTIAGCLSPHGYLTVGILGYVIPAHHVIWAMHTGTWSEKIIDHKNRIRSDNRIENLREADKHQNGVNSDKRRFSYIGVRGVTKVRNKFRVIIYDRGKPQRLGYFSSLDEAIRVATAKYIEVNGKFAPQSP